MTGGLAAADAATRSRGSSSSTIKALHDTGHPSRSSLLSVPSSLSVEATVWIHDDQLSTEDILINDSLFQEFSISEGDLLRISTLRENTTRRDLQQGEHDRVPPSSGEDGGSMSHSPSSWLCLARFAQAELKAKQPSLQISIKSTVASVFGFRHGTQIRLQPASAEDCTASHVEFSFRDTYLARSDMWRLIGQELSGRTVYTGQRITFLGSIRLTVKSIHIDGHKASTAFFSGFTLPVFRSEAARYVLFIQMSQEMWDFDSEGSGEILFNRVINGFLPDLFKRWNELEVRHLVSILLFGRQEYRQVDIAPRRDTLAGLAPPNPAFDPPTTFQDFYRVVVTDMASAQWTTILDELKKEFRVFLRDISLHPPPKPFHQTEAQDGPSPSNNRITGKPSTAMKGNILEAINLAATQFSNDYVDRDLIRTGVSVVVVTAGTGVFEVERDMLNLTSQNLTNNGIGIDIVCLSKMPLHSVPLFKYRPFPGLNVDIASQSSSPRTRPRFPALGADQSQSGSPVSSSINSHGLKPWSRASSAAGVDNPRNWCYGVPHWIDLSYWAPDADLSHVDFTPGLIESVSSKHKKELFVPRVRMYEVQMMGLMEMGMADISIPWISDDKVYRTLPKRRKNSTIREWGSSRSLSHSPSLYRRPPYLETALSTGIGLPMETKLNLDHYDEAIFKLPTQPKLASPIRAVKTVDSNLTVFSHNAGKHNKIKRDSKSSKAVTDGVPRPGAPLSPTSSVLSNMLVQKKTPDLSRAVRSTSYALRGLAPPIRSTASTEVNIEHARAEMPKATPSKARPTIATTADSFRTLSTQSGALQSEKAAISDSSQSTYAPSQTGDERPSTPIKIQQPNGSLKQGKESDSPSRNQTFQQARDEADSSSSEEDEADWQDYGSITGSIPRSNVPFVRNINASNPLKGNPNREAFFGRWQHLYPRKPRAATVKWRSLCTPAAVPLTTEEFPPKDVFENNYDSTEYSIGLESFNEQIDKPESRDELFREMLSLRFAHGYQLIVGPKMRKFEGPNVGDPSFFFNPKAIRSDGHCSFLSMGNTIQRLGLVENNRITVTKYVRRPLEVQPPFSEKLNYYPHIRTILSDQYRERAMQTRGFTEEYPWELADRYLAASRKSIEREVEVLRFWRARFVLLPVEPPPNAFRPTQADSEENEEEIHLRGIRILTQMWQRTRYVPPEERRPGQNRMSAFKKKDRNPLRINMETLNPSELVATELDKLLAAEEAGDIQTAQLLPEEEQFERETADLSRLAAALQGDRGIEIKNRRWHLRLHYSCFLGEDFTTWLVQNFRDLDTRDEAIELGNDLMKEGLFEHVNSRHNFKDGNFFYSIKPEYRMPRSELRQTWFPPSRRSDRSTPATPFTENPSRDSPLSVRSRSGSSLAAALNKNPPNSGDVTKPPTEKSTKRLAVSLSKVIRLDVDVRRRSNRPEVVNLHYDRLHNPENCYHLELSWFNVTSKLVDDAIVSWTTQAEKYGLKLVEVPISEMSKIPDNEPFRAPYRVKLISQPPDLSTQSTNGNGNMYFTATSFTPMQSLNSDKHYYQKQLLKRFNFVLDLEAVSEFPDNVEINYSWGKLDYRFTQFVHRSGVILAQITDEGDILMLANRLYNSRLASTRDTGGRFDKDKTRDEPGIRSMGLLGVAQTQMQASGIVGLNVASPMATPMKEVNIGAQRGMLSPFTGPVETGTSRSANLSASSGMSGNANEKISADVFGSRQALGSSGLSTYVTPEQIKDDLEAFCSDQQALEAFYAQVTRELEEGRDQSQYQGQGLGLGGGAGGAVSSPPSALEMGQGGALGTGIVTGSGVGSGAAAGPAVVSGSARRATTGPTSSSLLRPVRESELEGVEGEDGSEGRIPEFRLPESLGLGGHGGRRSQTK